MKENKITLGNKSAFCSEPFNPRPELMKGFTGRVMEQHLITAAWLSMNDHLPLNPLLLGGPGVGKNRLVYELAKNSGNELYIFQGHEDVTAEDLACSVRFSDQGNMVMDYILSPLVTAMINGGICFIDEIGKIRPRALALLVSVLDERRYIDSTLLGERIYAHDGFRFIAATNSADINLLPEFILSRMKPLIKVDYPTPLEIDDVIREHFKGMNGEVNKLLDVFWALWREQSCEHNNLSVRDAINVFGLASKLAAFEFNCQTLNGKLSKSAALKEDNNGNSFFQVGKEHLDKAFFQMISEKS